jgi:hypothetical protein
MTTTGKDANGSVSLIEASVPPGGGPVAHVRATTDGDHELTARTGDFLFFSYLNEASARPAA